ncbi:xylulokinase [Acuticoccus sp. M5D2P5]|uniref:xylulokinase n=1 Tax=Acuticoccus kalidii TaxID=2910977 RepID=UPI001F15B14B|nr:xylulokinase [Acuticoccus kalidii]
MSVTIGIDLGTSGVKAVIAEGVDEPLAEADKPIAVSAPHPGWSEQDPDLWCAAVGDCLDRLAADHPHLMARVAAIGLSGQMLGAVLIDAADRPVRPAILWNDQRSIAECAELARRVPDIGMRTNGRPDPGLTAPKLLWLAAHEPASLDAAATMMLPKDYVRLWMTGEHATEASDASGTMLMDNASATWDAALCEAAGWSPARLPTVVPSWSAAGGLRPALAARWGLAPGLPIAAGAGDNMAASLGAGVAAPGDALITIGTSAVVCAVDGAFRPAPQDAVLTGVHAAPEAYLSMAVVMSATSAFAWTAGLTGASVPELAAEVDGFAASGRIGEAPLALPSLSGLRTPHNRPDVGATFTGLTGRTDRAALGYAVLEGVAFQLRECVDAQRAAGLSPSAFFVVGGGARNGLWLTLIATMLGRPLQSSPAAPMAAPLGAVRLARIAAGLAAPSDLAEKSAPTMTIEADTALNGALADRFGRYREMLCGLGIMTRTA